MRILTASRFANEVGVETYTANDLTKAFLQPGIEDAVRHGSVKCVHGFKS